MHLKNLGLHSSTKLEAGETSLCVDAGSRDGARHLARAVNYASGKTLASPAKSCQKNRETRYLVRYVVESIHGAHFAHASRAAIFARVPGPTS